MDMQELEEELQRREVRVDGNCKGGGTVEGLLMSSRGVIGS